MSSRNHLKISKLTCADTNSTGKQIFTTPEIKLQFPLSASGNNTSQILAGKPIWFVMKHLDMKRFKAWLEVKNTERLDHDRAVIEPFYPYDYLNGREESTQEVPLTETEKRFIRHHARGKKAVVPKTKTVVAETQNDFQDIVFLKALEDDIRALVDDEWNKAFRIQLRYLIDPATKQPAKVSNDVMDKFYANCIKYRGRFELCPPVDGIEKKDRVEIKRGVFSGHEAFVTNVRHSKGEIHLDLAVQLVTGVISIRMPDVKPQDVVLLNKTSVDAIRTDFIDYIQDKLLAVYEHRVKTVNDAQTRLRDAATLSRLFLYNTYNVEGRAARTHFKALMLICAHLRKDTDSEQALKEEALRLLDDINRQSESKASTDIRTWLWIALYISTNDPLYRDAAKQYVKEKQPKSKRLCQFVRLMRVGKKA